MGGGGLIIRASYAFDRGLRFKVSGLGFRASGTGLGSPSD